MPIYEYQCNNCDHTFDLLQKMSDPPSSICPECEKDALVKLISAPNFQLKGTGWYATDFKTKAKTPDKTSDNASGNASGNASDKSSEKKTQTKTESSKPAAKEKSEKK